jgi:hypothetical protein
MGNDGGVQLTRALVKAAAGGGAGPSSSTDANSAAARQDRAAQTFRYCARSGKLLSPPVVVDRNGRVMRREAALEEMLEGSSSGLCDPTIQAPPSSSAAATSLASAPLVAIRSKRDVVDVADVPALSREPTTETDVAELLKCAVTGTVCSTAADAVFVALWKCGHICLERTIVATRGTAVSAQEEHDDRRSAPSPSSALAAESPAAAATEPPVGSSGGVRCPACGALATAMVRIGGGPQTFKKFETAADDGRREERKAKRAREIAAVEGNSTV